MRNWLWATEQEEIWRLWKQGRALSEIFLKVANAEIEFVSEGGRVTGLILYQGGRETKAARQ